MSVVNVKVWMWMVIGVLVGLGYDQVQRLPRGDWRDAYGRGMNQSEFETALRAPASYKPFKNLVIYTESIRDLDGQSRTVYVVAGDHATAGGGWEKRCFVSDA